MAKPLPDSERAEIVAAIRAGEARNQIARRFGRAAGTITNIARTAGITDAFDRSATKDATEARRADNAARRASLITDLYNEAHHLVHGKLKSPHVVHHFTKDGGFVTGTLDGPTSTDVRNYWVSIGIALDKARQLEAVDDGTATEAVSFLEQLVAGIKK